MLLQLLGIACHYKYFLPVCEHNSVNIAVKLMIIQIELRKKSRKERCAISLLRAIIGEIGALKQ